MSADAESIVALLVLMALAVAVSAALRCARLGATGVLGGVIVGALLGPTLLGRVAPSIHERAFVGGVEERRVVTALELEWQAWQLAAQEVARTANDPPDVQAQIDHQHDAQVRLTALVEARGRMDDAVYAHRRPFRAIAVVLAAIIVGVAGWRWSSHPAAALSAAGAQATGSRTTGAWAIGGFAAVTAGAGGIGVAMLAGAEPLGAAALACAAALAVGPWRLSARDLRIAHAAERDGPETIRRATCVAALASAVLLAASSQNTSAMALLGVAVIVVLIGVGATPIADRMAAQPIASGIALGIDMVLVPAVAALTMVRLEILIDARLWPLVLLPLLSGDGRWIGGMIGALLLGGRGPGAASRLLLVLAAAGPTQVAVVAIVVWTELLPAPLALGLVAGALLVDLTGPLRRRAERVIAEAERTNGDFP